MTWFTLTLTSQFTLIAYYFLSKRLLNKTEIDSRIYGACLQICSGLVALPFALMTGFKFEITPTSLILTGLMLTVYVIGPSLYYLGLKHVDLSELTILDASGVLWSMLFGVVLLQESFTGVKILGVLLILMAVILIGLDTKKLKLRFTRYELMVLFSTIFYTLGASLDNRLINFSNAISYLPISFLGAGILMLLINVPRFKTVGRATFGNKSFYKTVFVSGIFTAITYLLIMKAYEIGGEISSMYPIQQLESVIIPIIGILILKERNKIPQKIIAVALSLGGVWLLR